MKRIFLLGTLIFSLFSGHSQQDNSQKMYSGHIHIGTDSLQLVIVMNYQGDSLTAVMDSPDQYTTDIPVDSITFAGGGLYFASNKLDCYYRGTCQKDNTIKGTFCQNGKKRKLILSPTQERQLFLRPQEPQPPFPYREDEMMMRYKNGDFAVEGTLTLPTAQAPKAVVVLLSGSGWQDRDENIYNHKPFKLIADQLTRAGYAVFRYDDPPTRKFAQMNTFDLADVAGTVVNSIKEQNDLQGIPVGVLGHSEGGLVAWMLASKRDDIDFVITMAAPAIPLDETILYQSRLLLTHNGADEKALQVSENLNRKIYAAIKKAKSPTQAGEKVYEVIQNMTDDEKQYQTFTPLEIAKLCAESSSNWFYTVLRINPGQYLKKVKCPLLALNGSKDSQVEAETNLKAVSALQKRNPKATIRKIEGVNHLFQQCETGMFDEYAKIEQTMSPAIFTILTEWLEQNLPK